MKNKNKTKFAVAALLAAMGQGAANADSLAYSNLTITDFKWQSVGAGGALTPLTNDPNVSPHLSILAGNNDSNISANFNGVIVPNGQSVAVSSGGQLPFQSVCSGPDCTNGTTPAPPPLSPASATSSLVSASSRLQGALLDIPAAGITGGVSATTIAESSLTTNSNLANGSSNTGTLTTAQFLYTGGNQLTQFDFNYFADALAKITNPSSPTDSTKATLAWNLTIDQADPTSCAANFTNCNYSNVFNLTPTVLNHTSGINGLGTDDWLKSGTLASLVGVDGSGVSTNQLTLNNNQLYRLNIGHLITTTATRNFVPVPEPAALLLLGMGFLGFGLQKRKNGKMMA